MPLKYPTKEQSDLFEKGIGFGASIERQRIIDLIEKQRVEDCFCEEIRETHECYSECGPCEYAARLIIDLDLGLEKGREWEQIRTSIETENERLRDALRRVLPMAEAWFRRNFDFICHHEPGECTCDAEAHARTDINIALATLGRTPND